jgi:hypothetical protein
MAKQALVVDSQPSGHEVPLSDAEQMAGVLEATGLKVDLRITAAAASCAGILEGYERLIQISPGTRRRWFTTPAMDPRSLSDVVPGGEGANFGRGRQPSQRLLHVQGFSLDYEILAID